MPNVPRGSPMLDEGAVAVSNDAAVARIVGAHVQPLTGEPSDFDQLLELVGSARFVLIGEASHGTHEFYRIRSEVTGELRRLVNQREPHARYV